MLDSLTHPIPYEKVPLISEWFSLTPYVPIYLRTLDRVCALYAEHASLVKSEAVFLEQREVGMVVVDIPALPIESAKQIGIPALAVGNFAWNWIYSAYTSKDPRWSKIIRALEQGYAQTDLLLRLPFSEDMGIFPSVKDISLVASPGTPCRSKIASRTGCSEEKKWILLSFTSLAWDQNALDRVEALREYEFLTVLPLAWERKNIHGVDRADIPYSDVMASVDGVLSKPGFGLLSECIVNNKPLLYAERTDFLEYPILEKGIQEHIKHHHIPAAKLYAGELEPYISELWQRPSPKAALDNKGAKAAVDAMAAWYAKSRITYFPILRPATPLVAAVIDLAFCLGRNERTALPAIHISASPRVFSSLPRRLA